MKFNENVKGYTGSFYHEPVTSSLNTNSFNFGAPRMLTPEEQLQYQQYLQQQQQEQLQQQLEMEKEMQEDRFRRIQEISERETQTEFLRIIDKCSDQCLSKSFHFRFGTVLTDEEEKCVRDCAKKMYKYQELMNTLWKKYKNDIFQ
jgi:predicted RNA-binding protein